MSKSTSQKSVELQNNVALAIEAWSTRPDLKMGEFSLEVLKACRDELAATQAKVDTKEVELDGLRIDLDEQSKRLNQMVRRARSVFRGVFGPDSKEYGQIGGTRASERRKPRRSPAKPAPLELLPPAEVPAQPEHPLALVTNN